MNFFQRLFTTNKVVKTSKELANAKLNSVSEVTNVADTIKKAKSYYGTQTFQSKKDIFDWKEAVDTSMQQPYYRKYRLYDICKQTTFDGLVEAQIQTRKNGTLSERYVLKNNGKDITNLIEKPYFRKIVSTILESIFWWASGMEISKTKDGNIECTIVEPQHLCNVRRLILPDPRNVVEGISIDAFSNFLMFSNEDTLGLLAKTSKYAIYKSLTESDWAQHSEVFGKPHIIMRTSETDDAGLNQKRMSLATRGANSFNIIDMEDELTTLDTKQTNPETMYKTFIETAEKNISWIIVGQQATSDQKSFVGSAQVQERILLSYITYDMIYVQNAINMQVLPLLSKLGVIPVGSEFTWEYFDEKKKVTSTEKVTPIKEVSDEKAKLKYNLATPNFDDFKSDEDILSYWEDLFISSLDANSPDYKSFLKNALEFAKAKYETYLKNTKDLDKLGRKMQFLLLDSDSKVEQNHFQASMQMATEWKSMLETAELYPNLRYQAVSDKNTRPDHLALSGVIKPLTDKFWDSYYPPISYRCRCTVRQELSDVKVTKGTPKDLPIVPKGLEGNPGKTGYAFSKNHPYFNN